MYRAASMTTRRMTEAEAAPRVMKREGGTEERRTDWVEPGFEAASATTWGSETVS